MMAAAVPTASSRERQKAPVAYSSLLRKMTSRVNQLHDELALESVNNIEFEQSSRRSFEILTAQVRNMKEAFDGLAESLMQELDHLGSKVRCELWRFEERQSDSEKLLTQHSELLRKQGRQQDRQEERQQALEEELQQRHQTQEEELLRKQERQQRLEKEADAVARAVEAAREQQEALERRAEALGQGLDAVQERRQRWGKGADLSAVDLREVLEKQQQLEKRSDLLAGDLNTVLGVVPALEDTVLKAHAHLQERITSAAVDISKVNDALAAERIKVARQVERLEARVQEQELESQHLREQVEQQHLGLQRRVARQLDTMGRVLVESERTPSVPPAPSPGPAPALLAPVSPTSLVSSPAARPSPLHSLMAAATGPGSTGSRQQPSADFLGLPGARWEAAAAAAVAALGPASTSPSP